MLSAGDVAMGRGQMKGVCRGAEFSGTTWLLVLPVVLQFYLCVVVRCSTAVTVHEVYVCRVCMCMRCMYVGCACV
jgi:hypothetical protein